MSIKTITKIACFVIPVVFTFSCSDASSGGPEHAQIERENAGFRRPEVIARISSKEINESSGLAVSKCQTDVFWTHNDSGDGPILYAINSRGEPLATYRVAHVRNIDWEDMSSVKTPADECLLYIGEIGDNEKRREEHSVYRLREPQVTAERDGGLQQLQSFDELRFKYPDERHDAEALLVNSRSGAIYIVTKEFAGPSHVYQLEPNFDPGNVQIATKIAEISLPASPSGFVTGGDISNDGKRVVLCDYYAGYELQLAGDASNFNEIWQQRPRAFDLGPREIGEAVAYADDGNSVFATTERLNAPLIRVVRN